MKARKIVMMLLIGVSAVLCGGCGKNEGQKAPESSELAETTVKEEKKNGEITKESLLEHEETPEEEFACVESKDGGVAIDRYNGTDEIVVIPETIGGETVVQINKRAFSSGCSVKAVKLADTVKELDEMAFAQNENLELVVCGSDLQMIGKYVFQKCENLSEVELNEGLQTIGQLSFSGCSALNSIYVPESVEEIGISAFGYLSPDDFVLQGKSGSVAETYAQSEDIKFEAQ